MNARDCLIGLHEMKGIGWKTIETLLLAVRPFEQVVGMEADELVAVGIPRTKAEVIRTHLHPSFVEERKQRYEERAIHILTVFDHEYPQRWRHSSQPPWVMYYKGDIGLLRQNCIAIVGTRSPTPYGRKVAEQFARELSMHSFTVVSGLARGIDSCAHKGALSGPGRTIAVLGTGAERVYPPENHRLFQQIGEQGLIVTEYPLATPTRPGLFPQRNRLIAALSLGTLVVEAARRSGSLITADMALEESRDVYAVPGPITSEQSAGTLDLIKQGAKLVMNAGDIMEDYAERTVAASHAQVEQEDVNLNTDEQKLLALIPHEPVTFDQLLEQSQFSFGHLHSVLLSLSMKKMIEPLPGSRYVSI